MPEDPIDFEITWDNHALLMKHFGITEDEATQCLLAVVGQDPKARKFWKKFVVKKPEEPAEPAEPTEQEIASTPKSPPPAVDPPKPEKKKRGLTKKERDARRKEEEAMEAVEESQVEDPLSESDAGTTEDEGESVSASSSSSRGDDPPPPPRRSAAPVKEQSKIVDELETQPLEPVEPVITPCGGTSKDDPGLEARAQLQLKQVPTPSKVVAAVEVGGGET